MRWLDTSTARQRPQEAAHPDDALGIHAIERFVEHQHGGSPRSAAAMPSRWRMPSEYPPPRRRDEANLLDHVVGSLCAETLRVRQPQQVVAGRPARLQRRGIEQRSDVAQRAAQARIRPPANGDNGAMDAGRLAVSAVLGMAAVGELAARLVAGTTVRAGLAAAQVTHTRGEPASGPADVRVLPGGDASRDAAPPAALGGDGVHLAVLSLSLFGLVTVAGVVALLIVAYRLALGGLRLPAVALAVPFLGLALAVAAFQVTAGVALTHGLSAEDAETRVLAVLLASAIPVAARVGMVRRADEERRSLSAVRELTGRGPG
jgi:hypothetical protein